MGGRGTFRAICMFPVFRIGEPPIAGRPESAVGGLGTPRSPGDGTPLPAFCGPCGMMREGVRGPEPVLPAKGLCPAAAFGPAFERPFAGGVIRETTERIAVPRGGIAAG